MPPLRREKIKIFTNVGLRRKNYVHGVRNEMQVRRQGGEFSL